MQLSPYKNTTKHTVVQLLPTFCILKWSSHETQSAFYNWFATGSPVTRMHERSDTSLTNKTNNNIVEILYICGKNRNNTFSFESKAQKDRARKISSKIEISTTF